ncbi:hypothetical protein [Nesterenkonia sp. NBAIMH1]|uniref:hypothetical protein n=1 Tax=Nesterenkonia sp. NBAIMH1 TaxID=2600320 RepID=UPI0011B35B6E|nr:hypothetical protein [Nesterenkonia sp. NBAIMH1]
MIRSATRLSTWRITALQAAQALRAWTPRQIVVAAAASAVVALAIGIATVLIPNPMFARDIPPVWWNYPVWLITSVLSGMLLATYVRASAPAGSGATPQQDGSAADDAPQGRRSSRLGLAGAFMAWFAVGCPVCNKIALVALGYSGAITYFAPIQPFLAAGAMVLTAAALTWRLKGQVACTLPAPQRAFAA